MGEDRLYKEAIDREYNKILERLQGMVSTLYGHQIDVSNERELVVAAYYMGVLVEMNEQERSKKLLDEIRELDRRSKEGIIK